MGFFSFRIWINACQLYIKNLGCKLKYQGFLLLPSFLFPILFLTPMLWNTFPQIIYRLTSDSNIIESSCAGNISHNQTLIIKKQIKKCTHFFYPGLQVNFFFSEKASDLRLIPTDNTYVIQIISLDWTRVSSFVFPAGSKKLVGWGWRTRKRSELDPLH